MIRPNHRIQINGHLRKSSNALEKLSYLKQIADAHECFPNELQKSPENDSICESKLTVPICEIQRKLERIELKLGYNTQQF